MALHEAAEVELVAELVRHHVSRGHGTARRHILRQVRQQRKRRVWGGGGARQAKTAKGIRAKKTEGMGGDMTHHPSQSQKPKTFHRQQKDV